MDPKEPNADERVVDPTVPGDRGDEVVDPQAVGGEVPEKTGETTPTEEPTPKATNEELQALNKVNQERLQRVLEMAEETSPELVTRYREEFPKPGAAPPVEETEEPEYDETELDTPGHLQKMEDRIIRRFENLQDGEKQAKAEGTAKEHFVAANEELLGFLQTNGFGQQALDWAKQKIAPLGIDPGTYEKPVLGGAAKYAYAIMNQLDPYVRRPDVDAAEAQRLARIEADAVDRGRTAGALSTPAGAPGGIAEASPEQAAANKIQPDTVYTPSE